MQGESIKKETVTESVKLEVKSSFNQDCKFSQDLIKAAFPSFEYSEVERCTGYKLLKERASK